MDSAGSRGLGVRLQDDAVQLLKEAGSESLYAVKRSWRNWLPMCRPSEASRRQRWRRCGDRARRVGV